MNIHCPGCHAIFSIEAFTQDAAARELLGMIFGKGHTPPSLGVYLTLFRSEKRSLSWNRALNLAKEALALTSNVAQLEAAMAETVESMRSKREQGQGKPLKNHNYLKRVLESMPADQSSETSLTTLTSQTGSTRQISKTASAIGALEQYKRG